MKVAA
jgi:hypothetical protein